MNRLSLFSGLFLSFLFFNLPAHAADRKPNVLVILADDMGWGELGCQGFTKDIPTPNIDSIAKAGTRFTSGYVSCPYCSPTRAGLMTGRYQQRFGHEFNPGDDAPPANFGLSIAEKTMGDRFKSIGYATGWFGKSHLGYEPQFFPLKRGFDEYFGFLGGMHDYLDAIADVRNPIFDGTRQVPSIEYTTESFGNAAVSFIDKHHAEPWLCYLPFNAVHGPLEATSKYLSRFPNVKDEKRRTFCSMLSAMDDAVGNVLAKLREHKLEENTLIFFLSDNGGPTLSTTSGNGPLRGYKTHTWEGGIRIPFIVQWKGHLPGGKVDDRPVISLDILPTALSAAGVQVDPQWKLDGVNLLPYISGDKKEPPHEMLFWRFGPQIAMRMGDWKLVKGAGENGVKALEVGGMSSTDGASLYNLANDISEKTNLASKDPERVKAMAAAWNKWNSELSEPKWVPNRKKDKSKKNERNAKGAQTTTGE